MPQLPLRLLDLMRQTEDPKVINLAAGIPSPDFLPLDALKAALEGEMSSRAREMFSYHRPEGAAPLREAIRDYLAIRGVRVTPEEVLVTTGCSGALASIMGTVLKKGDTVVCEAPAYYGQLELLRAVGVKFRTVSTAVGWEKALKAKPKPKLLVVTSSLSNPSGATLREEWRPKLVEICRKAGVLILEDDIYGDLLGRGRPKPLRAFDDGSTVLYATSFSKTVAPGLRIGFCLPGKWMESAADRQCRQSIHGAVPPEYMTAAFLRSGRMESHLEMLKTVYGKRRELAGGILARELPEGYRADDPGGGYMLWIRGAKAGITEEVRKKCLERGVAVVGGGIFFAVPPKEACFRLNCARVTPEDLARGVGVFCEVLKAEAVRTGARKSRT
ncbi:MAG: PLP-dependent aminotransferase family protein [Verrucomicrobia bacterium]|nr:PLP-dependent aminotransferase family protein [Verrucomicrobiota bacterium]